MDWLPVGTAPFPLRVGVIDTDFSTFGQDRTDPGALRRTMPRASSRCWLEWLLVAYPPSPDVSRRDRSNKEVWSPQFKVGAGDGLRTRYLDLGKVALYQVSYSRS